MSKPNLLKIENMIYVVRGQKVMLDADLAELYEVDTKVLNQAVRRNIDRFPKDFMFQLTTDEFKALKSQFVTSKNGRGGNRKLPLVFTESGLAMLSGVLNSARAINVNIAIMRIFTRLRSFHSLSDRLGQLEEGTSKLFKIVFQRLDGIEDIVETKLPKRKKQIGLK